MKYFTNKNAKIIFYVLLITLIFISLLAVSRFYLQNRIDQAELEYNSKQLSSLLLDINYNNNLLDSEINLDFINNIKIKQNINLNINHVYKASFNNKATALIFNIVTPDGYNGNINLLVAIMLKSNNKYHTIINTKVLNHTETPGLGDLIEPEKSNWIKQFVNKYIINSDSAWGLKKDLKSQKLNNTNNQFDSLTGATITSRAVSNAIKDCLILTNYNNSEILTY